MLLPSIGVVKGLTRGYWGRYDISYETKDLPGEAVRAMNDGRQELLTRLACLTDRLIAQGRQTAMEGWPEHDLTMPQLRALNFLGRGPRRMGDLAAHLGSSVSATTNLIERLETRGLVARTHDTADRRVVHCALTRSGRVLMEHVWRAQRLELAAVADILEPAELTRVIEALDLLAAAFDRRSPEIGAATGAREAALALG